MAKKKDWDEMSRNEKIGGLVGLVVIAVILVFIFNAVFSGHKSTPLSATKASVAKETTKPASTPKAEAPKPTTGQQVAMWFSTYGYIITSYNDDFTKIGTDAGNSNTVAVGNDCATLNADVKKAQGFPAIPDAQSASDFGSALSYYQTGAEDCVTAAQNNDNDGLVRAAGEISKGNDKIKATISDIKKASS